MAMSPETSASVAGSVGVTLNSIEVRTRVAPTAPAAPGDADAGERQALPQDERENLSPVGSQGHADADFLRALRDQVREYAVRADRREGPSASAAKIESSIVMNLGRAIASPKTSSID